MLNNDIVTDLSGGNVEKQYLSTKIANTCWFSFDEFELFSFVRI